MTTTAEFTVAAARREVCVASSGGAPFLWAFGLTLGLTGVAGFWLDARTIALITMFQGNVGLPLAFYLEKKMALGPWSPDNPLKGLSIQLAMSQLLAFPVVILLFNMAPATVPMAMAAIGAAHFLPYAWLQSTKWYIALAVAVGAGSFVITAMLRSQAAPWVLLFMTTTYFITAIGVRRRAQRFIMAD